MTEYDVLVCAAQLSWEIPHSSGPGFICQGSVIMGKYDIDHDLEPAPLCYQDIPEYVHDVADICNKVDSSQSLAISIPVVVESHASAQSLARSDSRYDLASNASLEEVNIWKADTTPDSLRSPVDSMGRSRSLHPCTRTSVESNFDGGGDGALQSDIARTVGVDAIMSATRKSEYAQVPTPSLEEPSTARLRLECTSQESYRFPA